MDSHQQAEMRDAYLELVYLHPLDLFSSQYYISACIVSDSGEVEKNEI